MEEHREIILEALSDYRGWFSDQPEGTPEEDEADKLKCEKIDNAINYLENLKNQ